MTSTATASLLHGNATPKGIRADAQRAVSPEATLDRVRPLFSAIGLTRLADITGLDSIGIPVVLSVRPQSGYLSVDGGKGFTRAAANASAAMECFERHAGEYTSFERFTCNYGDLPAEARIRESDLPLSRNSLYSPALEVPWTWAQDLLGGPTTAVPTVMVGLERHKHQRASALPFHFSSNGLNSGNTKSEALIGALYEVIERDATTCTKVSWEQGSPMRRVDMRTATSPDIAYLVERIRAAGLEVVVIDCTVDTEVPTFSAYLCDVRNPAMGVYHGYGTHLDPEVAVIRAICEAAQGRLVFIAGSRDDSFRHHRRLHSVFADAHRILLGLPEDVDLRTYADESGDTFEADGRTLVGKLAAIGVTRILTVDLTHPDIGVDVFRVIVPGLEGYMLEDFSAGARARGWAERSAEFHTARTRRGTASVTPADTHTATPADTRVTTRVGI
jgi:ribosomal protein S12 methylthiotransferase accessory factor